jgi:hypothetical protein
LQSAQVVTSGISGHVSLLGVDKRSRYSRASTATEPQTWCISVLSPKYSYFGDRALGTSPSSISEGTKIVADSTLLCVFGG